MYHLRGDHKNVQALGDRDGGEELQVPSPLAALPQLLDILLEVVDGPIPSQCGST